MLDAKKRQLVKGQRIVFYDTYYGLDTAIVIGFSPKKVRISWSAGPSIRTMLINPIKTLILDK